MAKKKAGIARSSVSLSTEIKRQMDKYPAVNWSEVARLAFEKKLAELAPKKELKVMASVIERLRGLEKNEQNEAEQAGAEAGRTWAKEEATPKELRRLDVFSNGADYEHFFESDDSNAFSPAERLVAVIQGDSTLLRVASTEFWEQVVGETIDWTEPGFAFGFVEGAMEVWDQVKDVI